MKQFDYLIYIGRFQPFHLAHLKTIQIALEQSEHLILALGSVQQQRDLKNPFFAHEREKMILSSLSTDDQHRVQFAHIPDVHNDEKWVKEVKDRVAEKIPVQHGKVGLIGHFKDDSSYYLKLFSEWELVPLESLENAISATPLREAYYQGQIDQVHFPSGTIEFLEQFIQTDDYLNLKQAYFEHKK